MENNIRFVELASGHITNRGNAIVKEDVDKYLNKEHELYHSWYSFDKELEIHLKKNRSIAGFKGIHYLNEIILDLDAGNLNDDQLLAFARNFLNIEMLEDLAIKPSHIQVWFSGTGFHFVIPDLFGFTPSITLPSSVKSTLQDIFPDCDNIYDGARLIRANNSYNKKSNLYKTGLTFKQLNTLSMDEIRKLASKPSVGHKRPKSWDNIEPYLKQFVKLFTIKDFEEKTVQRSAFDIDPNRIVTCLQTILSKPPVAGERNQSMMRIASWMRRSGIPREVIADTLKRWSGNPAEALSTTKSEFEKGYNYWCEDHIMSKYCDPKCIHFERKDYSMALETAETLADKFHDFVKDGISKKAFNLADYYSVPTYWTMPGELVILLGDTGMGKSTFLSNLASKLTQKKIMYLSLENSYHQTYGRLCQITHGMTDTEVKEYSSKKTGKALYKTFDHIQFAHIQPNIEKLKETVAQQEPDIVMVDTTDELIVSKSTDGEIGRMNIIIGALKDIAKRQDCIVVAVHHINKDSAVNENINIHSAKGTTNTVQKADKVWTINDNGRNGNQRLLKSEKNRDGGFIKILFEFNKRHMKFDQHVMAPLS
jgi:archaellum biogenesis ATPase FlaH